MILMSSKVHAIRPRFIKEMSLLTELTFRCVSQHHQSMNKSDDVAAHDVARRNETLVLLKKISFINHGLIACTLLGINIYSKIEIPAWILVRDNIYENLLSM